MPASGVALLTLYGFLASGNVWKVRQMLVHAGLSHRRVEVSQMAGETSHPSFLAINPMGKVPVLRFADGRILSESGAILLHLAAGTRYWPDAPWEQAQALRWMFWEQYSHEPAIAVNRYWLSYQQPEARAGRDDLLAANRLRGTRALAIMDDHLATRDWFTGPQYGIADIALYAYTHVAEEGGFDLHPHPHICRWLQQVESQPGHIGLGQETSAEPVRTLAEDTAAGPG
jgi:glutathione S-transferase